MNSISVRQPDFMFEDDLALMPDSEDTLYSAFSCSVTILAPQGPETALDEIHFPL